MENIIIMAPGLVLHGQGVGPYRGQPLEAINVRHTSLLMVSRRSLAKFVPLTEGHHSNRQPAPL